HGAASRGQHQSQAVPEAIGARSASAVDSTGRDVLDVLQVAVAARRVRRTRPPPKRTRGVVPLVGPGWCVGALEKRPGLVLVFRGVLLDRVAGARLLHELQV